MKKIAGAILFFSFVSVFISCNWRIPETIAVRSNADYNFSLGNFNQDLDSQMNLQAMLGNVGSESSGIQVYDYFPGKTDANAQHFLLKVKVYEMDFAQQIPSSVQQLIQLMPEDASIDLTDLSIPLSYGPETKGLQFNPSSMLAGLRNATQFDFADKIEFTSVPLYLYCKVTDGLSAKATLKMYYGSSSDPVVLRPSTEFTVFNNSAITNRPIPQFATEENTVITNLENTQFITKVDVADLINCSDSSVQENDQLCVTYIISDISGTITKAALQNGLKIEIYAALDLPLRFNVKDNLQIDLASLNNSSSNSSSGSTSFSLPELNAEVKKLLGIIESISVNYTAYKLPFYSTSGIFLGVDLLGNGQYQYGELSIADENHPRAGDQHTITIPSATILALRNQTSINPGIKVKIANNTVFSIPRSKNIKMNVQLGLTTNGDYQIK